MTKKKLVCLNGYKNFTLYNNRFCSKIIIIHVSFVQGGN